MSGEAMPMSQNREGREFFLGGGVIELGAIEQRKEGGKICLIQKKGKKGSIWSSCSL